MAYRRPNPATFETLEGRLLMAASKPSPTLPYSVLTLTGGFELGVPVTVTFQSQHHGTITVPASTVGATSATVAVPFFLDSKRGLPVAETAKVTAKQGSKTVATLSNLSIASLPETGLPAGTLLAETASELHAILGDVIMSLAPEIEPPQLAVLSPPNPAETTTLQLLAIDQAVTNLEAGIAPILAGKARSVTLGTFEGKPTVIDANALSLVDRGIAAVVDNPIGTTSTNLGLTGPSLAGGLLDVINGALAGGRPTILGAAGRLLNVLETGPGSTSFPTGPLLTGLALGDTVALVAVAEAEVGTYSGQNASVDLGNYQLAYLQGNLFLQAADEFLANPIISTASTVIETGLKPTTAAGKAILGLAVVNGDLAQELAIGPNTLGAELQQELSGLIP